MKRITSRTSVTNPASVWWWTTTSSAMPSTTSSITSSTHVLKPNRDQVRFLGNTNRTRGMFGLVHALDAQEPRRTNPQMSIIEASFELSVMVVMMDKDSTAQKKVGQRRRL